MFPVNPSCTKHLRPFLFDTLEFGNKFSARFVSVQCHFDFFVFFVSFKSLCLLPLSPSHQFVSNKGLQLFYKRSKICTFRFHWDWRQLCENVCCCLFRWLRGGVDGWEGTSDKALGLNIRSGRVAALAAPPPPHRSPRGIPQ